MLDSDCLGLNLSCTICDHRQLNSPTRALIFSLSVGIQNEIQLIICLMDCCERMWGLIGKHSININYCYHFPFIKNANQTNSLRFYSATQIFL